MKDESGFTLVELLAVMLLTAILVTLGAAALRRFWFVQGLSGARNEVVSQLRAQQEESRTTAPKVFGARFNVGSSEWDLIQYDDSRPNGLKCTRIEGRTLGAGVVVQEVDFDDVLGIEQGPCLAGGFDELVLFYARGSATAGGLTLYQPTIDRELSVCVTGLTGRVEGC